MFEWLYDFIMWAMSWFMSLFGYDMPLLQANSGEELQKEQEQEQEAVEAAKVEEVKEEAVEAVKVVESVKVVEV